MHQIATPDALHLTGLSTEQLREWTIRRDLIPADVKPKERGSPARYSWQTILLLRLAVVLRDQFKVELQTHRELFHDVSTRLKGMSFVSLWGKSLALHGSGHWLLLDLQDGISLEDDYILLRLTPHLQVLSERLSLPNQDIFMQYPLFPALGLPSSGGASRQRRSA